MKSEEIKKNHLQRIERAQYICSFLLSKYKTTVCNYDRTAVTVAGITEKQLEQLCKELHCSGIYSGLTQSGILTNFGEYK